MLISSGNHIYAVRMYKRRTLPDAPPFFKVLAPAYLEKNDKTGLRPALSFTGNALLPAWLTPTAYPTKVQFSFLRVQW